MLLALYEQLYGVIEPVWLISIWTRIFRVIYVQIAIEIVGMLLAAESVTNWMAHCTFVRLSLVKT